MPISIQLISLKPQQEGQIQYLHWSNLKLAEGSGIPIICDCRAVMGHRSLPEKEMLKLTENPLISGFVMKMKTKLFYEFLPPGKSKIIACSTSNNIYEATRHTSTDGIFLEYNNQKDFLDCINSLKHMRLQIPVFVSGIPTRHISDNIPMLYSVPSIRYLVTKDPFTYGNVGVIFDNIHGVHFLLDINDPFEDAPEPKFEAFVRYNELCYSMWLSQMTPPTFMDMLRKVDSMIPPEKEARDETN